MIYVGNYKLNMKNQLEKYKSPCVTYFASWAGFECMSMDLVGESSLQYIINIFV